MDMEHEIKKDAPSAQQAAGSIDTGELRRLAEAAKDSGDWLSVDRTVYALEHHGWRKGEELFRNRFSFNVQRGPEFDDKDCAMVAEFCAAANPAAILRLLDALAATPAQPIAPQTEVPQGFIDYVQANYNGVIDIHRPEWHAKRLWNAAMHQIKVAQPIADMSAPTDISTRLRAHADRLGHSSDDATVMRLAADECERFYGGMLAWKQTAEKKDSDWNTERMGRVNDRIAARAAAPVSGPTIKSFAAQQNAELVLARLEQMHKDSVPGSRRDQIEEAMPCMLAVLRHLSGNSAAPVSGQGASELPPLPEKDYFGERRNGDDIEGHTDEAMTTYGQLCIDSRPRSEDSRAKALEAALSAITAIYETHKHLCDDTGGSFFAHASQIAAEALASTTSQKADNE